MGEALTVRELIQETDLGLELVGAAGLEGVIRGIHLSDLEDPTPFMTPGMILLTTGEAFASSPSVGIGLLDHLAALDGAALGVGVGHYLDHVDPAMIARAGELRLPVFEAPLSVPFRTITSYVYNALASTDMHLIRRSLAVQGHLLDLMLEQRGVRQLVAELASILEAEILLFDSEGAAIAQAGSNRLGRKQDVWQLYRGAEGDIGPLGILEDGTNRIFVRRVVVHGVLERVLVAVIPGASSAQFVDTALSFAQRLLVLERLQEGEQIIVRRRMRSLLLDDFLADHGSPEDYLARFREQGMTLCSSWRIAVFSIDAFQREVTSRRLTEERIYEIKSTFISVVDRLLARRGLPFLTSVKGDSVVSLLVVGDDEPQSAFTVVSEVRTAVEEELAPFRITVGCSGPAVGLKDGGRHSGDAMEALKMAKEGLGVTSRVVLFDEAGGRFRLVEGQGVAALSVLRRRLVAPLEEYDRLHRTALVETLTTYLGTCLSPNQTAEVLIIHRSTLRKRLRRIEGLIDVELGRLDDIVELHLALRATELLQAQEQD
jgi:PucR family transcriptional regulator, purine catabolism regulatory protein